MFGEFGVPTAAEMQIDREIADAQAAFAAGREISQIEPWRDRLARCCPAVQAMMEIDSLLAVDEDEAVELELAAEPRGEERPYDEAMQVELRIALYSLQVEIGEIKYVPSTTIL